MMHLKNKEISMRYNELNSYIAKFPSLLETISYSHEQVLDKNHKIDEYYMLLNEISDSEALFTNDSLLEEAYSNIDIIPIIELDMWEKLIIISLLPDPVSLFHFKFLLNASRENPFTILANLICKGEAFCSKENLYLNDLQKAFILSKGIETLEGSFKNSLYFLDYAYTNFKNYYDLYSEEFISTEYLHLAEYINRLNAERILIYLRNLDFSLKSQLQKE